MATRLDPLATVYSRVPINAEDGIRLLLLHATKATRPADEIYCSLVVRRREDVFDKYYALSYTWGDSDCHHTITVNGVEGVPVTHNLFAALKRLRDLDTFQTRTSWIDALCINQADSAERSSQVRRMREVYHSADRVVIWLGDSNYLETHPAAGNLWKSEQRRQSLYQAVRETSPSWWERVWVFQEFAFARKPPVFCFGSHKIESMEFKTLLQSLNKISLHRKEQPPYAATSTGSRNLYRNRTAVERIASLKGCLDSLEVLRANRKKSLELSFAEMVKQTTDAEATDPRDKIFSLVGFLKPEVADVLRPDYSKSIGAVCAAASYTYILEMGITAALSRVRLSLSKIGECSKPSWAITFDTFPDFADYTSKSPFSCEPPYLESTSTSSKSLQFNSDINSLEIRGWAFDRVCEIVDHPSAELPSKYNELFAKFRAISKKAKRNESYIDAPDRLDPTDNDQLRVENEFVYTPGSNPYRPVSPLEAMNQNPSYRPFSTDSSPAGQCQRIKRELRSVLQQRRGWMRQAWKDWDEGFQRKVSNIRNEEWEDWNEEFETEMSNIGNEWDLRHANNAKRPHEILLQRLRSKYEDAEDPPRSWSARLNFGLYHNIMNSSTCPANFMRYTDAAMGRCAVFITNDGFVGVASASISENDLIAILSGSTMPVVLRRVDDHYTFQGLAYVVGIMHDELLDVVANSSMKFEHQTFEIR